jgi:hypothetical protein
MPVRTICRCVVLCLALALPAARARAFVLDLKDVGGQLRPGRWPEAEFPIRFVLNDRPLDLLRNLAASSTPSAAIEAAMHDWNLAPVGLLLDGTAPTTDAGYDGYNLVTFADTPKNRDVVGNFWAVTTTWRIEENGDLIIVEADIAFNPQPAFATDGTATSLDIQHIATHELGHALGLSHSPFLAATMYPKSSAGDRFYRVLTEDDMAGLRALYGGDTRTDLGAITGRVAMAEDAPVFGAHVVAADASGIIRVGAVTDREGAFEIPALPAGDYQVYVEPLDGPFLPENLPRVFQDPDHPVVRNFRLTFAGGGPDTALVPVTAGEATALDPIRVESQPVGLKPRFLAWSPDGSSYRIAHDTALQIEPGQTRFLAVMGEGLTGVPRTGFRFSGGDLTINTSRMARGLTTTGLPYAIFPLTVRAGAPGGIRTLFVSSPTERAALTGAIEVITP